jgi:hypothetical protein
MKYSFIKDLNGLEIVIMYISVLSVEHTKCTTNTWEKNKGVFWYVNCTLEILKTRVEKKQMLKFDFNTR